jgi:hypothetical protein
MLMGNLMKKNFTHNLRDAINNCPSRGTEGMMMREMVITVTLEIEVSSIGLQIGWMVEAEAEVETIRLIGPDPETGSEVNLLGQGIWTCLCPPRGTLLLLKIVVP